MKFAPNYRLILDFSGLKSKIYNARLLFVN